MRENINTPSYWENRFSSGDWEAKRGRWQTENFARCQVPYLRLESDFAGTLLDFGCGLGDAMPIYRERFPKAKLIGVDISQNAIERCRQKYGVIAEFIQGDHDAVPEVDAIIASNVLEHLTDDCGIAKQLLAKCNALHVVVPYKEWPLQAEHVNSYDVDHFSDLGEYRYRIFPSVGWSVFGLRDLWYEIYLKNVFRVFLHRPLRHRSMQILFHFENRRRQENLAGGIPRAKLTGWRWFASLSSPLSVPSSHRWRKSGRQRRLDSSVFGLPRCTTLDSPST